MKKTMFWLFAIVATISFSSCSCSKKEPAADIKMNVSVNQEVDASKGLDLSRLPAIIKQCKDAESIEQELNKEGGINNLDLNQDGKVDYVSVKEYDPQKANVKGFSLYIDRGNNDIQDVASIEITQTENKQAEVYVSGSTNIYGEGAYYSHRYDVGDMLLMAWLFSHRPIFVSPYHYGYYPGYYHPYVYVPHATYASRVQRYNTVSRTTTTRVIKSPNVGRTSPSVTAKTATMPQRSLNNATNTAKSFQSRDANKSVGSGGFGKPNTSAPSKPSFSSPAPSSKPSSFSRPSSSPSRSSGGFGGGRRR